MSGAFLAGVVAGYGIAVPVGAIGVLIAGLSARTSLRIGAAAGMGAATADGIYALVAVAGGAAVAGVIAPVEIPLRWLGAAVLLALAGWTVWGALRSSGSTPAEDRLGAAPTEDRLGSTSMEDRLGAAPAEDRPGVTERDGWPATAFRAYAGVLALTLLNPATVIYFAALVLGSGGAGGGVWFVTGAFLASASWQLLIAGGGSLIGCVLTSDRGRLLTTLVSSAVIAVLAISLLIT